MSFLIINTAGPIIEAAAFAGDMRSYIKLDKVMASEQLLPSIDKMICDMGIKIGDFDDFVCVVGPGSFTGIRIGVNTARAFGYALGKNVYGVTYSRVIAYSSVGRVTTFIDGGGNACYKAEFDGDETIFDDECIYKKDAVISGECIADFDMGIKKYEGDCEALIRAARYAIEHKGKTDPIYIRKPQPERRENDI